MCLEPRFLVFNQLSASSRICNLTEQDELIIYYIILDPDAIVNSV